MENTDCASAIDDSFAPIHFQPGSAAAASRPGVGGLPLTNENITRNGPRSGHWSVSDSLYGSGIDNGCPTVHQLQPNWDQGSVPSLAGHHVQPIAGSVLNRLGRTVAENKRVQVTLQSVVAEAVAERTITPPAIAQPAEPKGFYIPRYAVGRGIRIKGKGGQDIVVKEPQMPTKASATYDVAGKEGITVKKTERARTPSPKPSVRSEKAVSIVSRTLQRRTKTIRIMSKNREEAVVELPTVPIRLRTSSGAPATGKLNAETEPDAKRDVKEDKAEKVKRDAKAAEAAKQVREEREQQQRYDQERAQEAKAAAEAMMSGALPASAKASTVFRNASVQSAKSSSKDSGVVLGGAFNATSKNPSVASSRTSVPQSANSASVRTVSRVSEVLLNETYKAPSSTGWKEMGVGVMQHASPEPASRQTSGNQQSRSVFSRVSEGRPAQSFYGAAGFEEVKSDHNQRANVHKDDGWASTPSADGRPESDRAPSGQGSNGWAKASSAQRQTSGSRALSAPGENGWAIPSPEQARPPQQSEDTNERTQTVFAGRGWISPHPLSRAPSEMSRPESVIKIPSGHGSQAGGTMTYEEWKAVQQSEKTESIRDGRRNISRTNSSAKSHAAGAWGYTASAVPSRVLSNGSQVWERNYQSPQVESVHSSRRSRSSWARDEVVNDVWKTLPQMDGPADSASGAKVFWPMPWDG